MSDEQAPPAEEKSDADFIAGLEGDDNFRLIGWLVGALTTRPNETVAEMVKDFRQNGRPAPRIKLPSGTP